MTFAAHARDTVLSSLRLNWQLYSCMLLLNGWIRENIRRWKTLEALATLNKLCVPSSVCDDIQGLRDAVRSKAASH
jgi:hypothetical protein